jgi:MoaA/NifB/PqqE/SkfB family radical SAM enzyme
MPAALIGEVTKSISLLASQQTLRLVHVNGHGETTFLSNWTKACRVLLDHDLPVMLTTNLSKRFSDEELETLARMHILAVSIDTNDRTMMRRLRRKVDLDRIVSNIEEIRKTARLLGKGPSPEFHLSCGLYDQNSLGIEGFAQFAIDLGVRGVGFWNLTQWHWDHFPYELTDVTEADRIYSLDDLTDDALRPRLEAIKRAIALLRAKQVAVTVNGDFVDLLGRRFDTAPQVPLPARSTSLSEGMTRNCLDPWCYAEVNPNGDIQPCCARPAVGNLATTELSDILDGNPIQRLRADLLEGHLDSFCANCTLRAPIEPHQLRQRVEESLGGLTVEADLWTVAARDVEILMQTALTLARTRQTNLAWMYASQALAIDPGVAKPSVPDAISVRNDLNRVLREARFPLTFSWLAALFRETGDDESWARLLRRYLEVAPDALDYDHVVRDLRNSGFSLEADAGQRGRQKRDSCAQQGIADHYDPCGE